MDHVPYSYNIRIYIYILYIYVYIYIYYMLNCWRLFQWYHGISHPADLSGHQRCPALVRLLFLSRSIRRVPGPAAMAMAWGLQYLLISEVRFSRIRVCHIVAGFLSLQEGSPKFEKCWYTVSIQFYFHCTPQVNEVISWLTYIGDPSWNLLFGDDQKAAGRPKASSPVHQNREVRGTPESRWFQIQGGAPVDS